MTGQRDDVGLQVNTRSTGQRGSVEEKFRAVEEWNDLLLENAARMDVHAHRQTKHQTVLKMANAESQLSLCFDNELFSED